MNPTETADVIEAMARALPADPQQFHISISVIGQRVTSYGGIGMQLNAVGGDPGSTTIGNQVTMGSAQIELAQQQGAPAWDLPCHKAHSTGCVGRVSCPCRRRRSAR